MRWEWPSFAPSEVLSPEGVAQWESGNLLLLPYFLDGLQSFREFLSRPILINHGGLRMRGYRSPRENESIGGARFSRHVQGIACDITVPRMSVSELGEAAMQFGFTGVGLYRTRNFVHIDARPGALVVWEQ